MKRRTLVALSLGLAGLVWVLGSDRLDPRTDVSEHDEKTFQREFRAYVVWHFERYGRGPSDLRGFEVFMAQVFNSPLSPERVRRLEARRLVVLVNEPAPRSRYRAVVHWPSGPWWSLKRLVFGPASAEIHLGSVRTNGSQERPRGS